MTNSDKPLNEIMTMRRQIDGLTDRTFRRVVQVLESARHHPEVLEVLEHVRPRLVRLRPPRPVTLRRVFYLPLEDLLVAEPESKADGTVPRPAATRAWSYVVGRLDGALATSLGEKLDGIAGRDMATQNEVGAALWPTAAAILDAAITDSAQDRDTRRALLGDEPHMMGDLVQVGRVLAVASDVQLLKERLPPPPITALTEAMLDEIRNVILARHFTDADRCYAVLLSVMARATPPGAVLEKLPRLLASFPEPVRRDIAARLAVLALGDMSRRLDVLKDAAHRDFAERAAGAGTLIDSLVAAEHSIAAGSTLVRKELKTVRHAAEAALNQIVDDARKVVDTGIGDGPKAPLDEQIATENSLLALRRCERYADRIGLDRSATATLNGVAAGLKKRAGDVVASALKLISTGAEAPEERRDEFAWAVRMLEITGDWEEAERVWRTGKSLLGTPPAASQP